jgi:protein tyrosine/serine phosphatase
MDGPVFMKKKNNTNKIIIAALIVGLGLWAWDQLVKDHVIPKRFGIVEQGVIYRSGRMSRVLVKGVLEKHNIKVIVALEGLKNADPDQQAEIAASKELGIDLLRFPLGGDGTGDVKNYIQAVTAIHQAKSENKPVLIHCAVGTQRTGGVLAIYHALFDKWTPEQVYTEMAKYDFRHKKNKKLVPYLNNNISEIVNTLKENGILTEVPDPLPVFITSD